MSDSTVAALIARSLGWDEAHASFDAATADVPEGLMGVRPAGLHHSLWEVLEHIRIAQADILEFCVNPEYREIPWPDAYWPASPGPRSAAEWDEGVGAVHRDLAILQALVIEHADDLLWPVAGGSGQTLLREALLVVDHTAYQVGQMVVMRQLLGIWG